MSHFARIPSRIRPTAVSLYIAVVSVAGVATVVTIAVADAPELPHEKPAIWLLTLCVLIGEMFPIRVRRPGAEGEITASTTFSFALVLSLGFPGVLLAAGASAATDGVRRKAPVKILFNASQYALSLGAAALLLHAAGVPSVGGHDPFLASNIPVIIVAAAIFFLVNSFLVAAVIALIEHMSVWRYFSHDFVFQASTAGLLLGLAPIVVLATDFSVMLLPLLALPLISIRQGQHQALVNEHQALHDALTGLPNRLLFHDRVEYAIRVSERDGSTLAVMLMDLDHFKEINDTLGHHHGDVLLDKAGRRLVETLRAGDTVARLGGDEFAILLPDVGDVGEATRARRQAGRGAQAPVRDRRVGPRGGRELRHRDVPAHGDDVETLVQRADIAMYHAKRGSTGVEVYSRTADPYSPRRLALASELRRGFDDDEIIAFYQPKADLATGRAVGVEALMRWRHPKRGLVLPGEFIPIAEQTGLIAAATLRVIDTALGQHEEWAREGLNLSVAVNLSARSLLDTRLPEHLHDLLERHGTSPDALCLEITESMIMADPERARVVLARVRDMGIAVSIDDFGTGYSSLAHLKRLPVDEIKIDRSFVMNMALDRSDAVIVRSTIELARNLGLRVVAEGVEDAAVWQELADLRCDLAQGYLISHAVPAPRIPEIVAQMDANADAAQASRVEPWTGVAR